MGPDILGAPAVLQKVVPRGLPAPLAGSLCPHPPLRGHSEPGPRHPSSLALRWRHGAWREALRQGSHFGPGVEGQGRDWPSKERSCCRARSLLLGINKQIRSSSSFSTGLRRSFGTGTASPHLGGTVRELFPLWCSGNQQRETPYPSKAIPSAPGRRA